MFERSWSSGVHAAFVSHIDELYFRSQNESWSSGVHAAFVSCSRGRGRGLQASTLPLSATRSHRHRPGSKGRGLQASTLPLSVRPHLRQTIPQYGRGLQASTLSLSALPWLCHNSGNTGRGLQASTLPLSACSGSQESLRIDLSWSSGVHAAFVRCSHARLRTTFSGRGLQASTLPLSGVAMPDSGPLSQVVVFRRPRCLCQSSSVPMG